MSACGVVSCPSLVPFNAFLWCRLMSVVLGCLLCIGSFGKNDNGCCLLFVATIITMLFVVVGCEKENNDNDNNGCLL